jgi:hypothetical protein
MAVKKGSGGRRRQNHWRQNHEVEAQQIWPARPEQRLKPSNAFATVQPVRPNQLARVLSTLQFAVFGLQETRVASKLPMQNHLHNPTWHRLPSKREADL